MNARDNTPDRWIRSAGDRALLICPPESAVIPELVAALRDRAPAGVQDVLPAAETILVTLLSESAAEPVGEELAELLGSIDSGVSRGTLSDKDFPGDPVLVPVHYDGADLAEVAQQLNLSSAEVVAAHTGTVWRCAFVGFAPGFGYLESPDGRLTVPRRAQSRTAIPAGAVALAGGYSAVYPRSTPAGWQLIGRTELPMWDVMRDPPALIRAGATVRFVDADSAGATG